MNAEAVFGIVKAGGYGLDAGIYGWPLPAQQVFALAMGVFVAVGLIGGWFSVFHEDHDWRHK